MNNQLIVNNSRGFGFALYVPQDVPFNSLDDAMTRINLIPLYNYIVINNPLDQNHGDVFQKIYSTDGKYTLIKAFSLSGRASETILTRDLTLVNESDDNSHYNFEKFMNDILDFFKQY